MWAGCDLPLAGPGLSAGTQAPSAVGDNAPMSDNAAAPDEVEIPGWVHDLVPIADLARSHLRSCRWTAAVMALAAVGAACVSTGPHRLARGLLIPFAVAGLILAGPLTGRPRRLGAPAGEGAAEGPLRPGGRTLAALLVLDIVGTALGLVVLTAAALCGIDGAVASAALLAGVLIAAGAVGVLVDELRPQARWGWVGACGGALLLLLLVGGAVLTLGRGLWWLTLGLVVAADLAGLLALRAGRRRDLGGSAR